MTDPGAIALSAVLGVPVLGAAVLALPLGYRLGARLNTLAALLPFVAAVRPIRRGAGAALGRGGGGATARRRAWPP